MADPQEDGPRPGNPQRDAPEPNAPRAEAANQAAQDFAEALAGAQRALANSTLQAQRLNARLGQEFYEGLIEGLGKRAENNRLLARKLARQALRQQEASQALARQSANAYIAFLNSVFSAPMRNRVDRG